MREAACTRAAATAAQEARAGTSARRAAPPPPKPQTPPAAPQKAPPPSLLPPLGGAPTRWTAAGRPSRTRPCGGRTAPAAPPPPPPAACPPARALARLGFSLRVCVRGGVQREEARRGWRRPLPQARRCMLPVPRPSLPPAPLSPRPRAAAAARLLLEIGVVLGNFGHRDRRPGDAEERLRPRDGQPQAACVERAHSGGGGL